MHIQKLHLFEAAGLGKAPFRVVGVEVMRGPILLPDGVTMIGSPGQPMGSCAFCGTGIAECWQIQSSDGKRFEVGCDCVRKTDDDGLREVVDEHKRKQRRDQNERRRVEKIAKDRARVAAARDLLSAAVEALRALPHPEPFYAGQGKTRLDWVEYLLCNAGTSGQVIAAGWIERAATGQIKAR